MDPLTFHKIVQFLIFYIAFYLFSFSNHEQYHHKLQACAQNVCLQGQIML